MSNELMMQYPKKTREDSGYSQGGYTNNYIDMLTNDFNNINLPQSGNNYFGSKCASDSGASTGDHDIFGFGSTMKEDMGAGQQLPGAWFYEVGDDASPSPVNEVDEAVLLQMRSALGVRNITQSVNVPSSEHVAEIVGRQGCKIKALRAKTNTYIKTPVRGEDPVFVVTGRPEDVMEAQREIECAADHFTQIRASRRHSQGGAPAPGHVTTYVRVPLRVVGLVVGPKGATIKRIQQDTHTYIITPSREREPIFEVTGLPLNVEAARKEIEQHIYQRTGNMPITDPTASISQYSELAMRNAPNVYAPPVRSGASSACADYHTDYAMRQLGNENLGLSSLLRSFPSMRGNLGSIGTGTPSSFNQMTSSRFAPSPSPTPFATSNVVNTQHVNYGDRANYQPWSSNTCLAGLLENDIFASQSRMIDSNSVWSSSLGMKQPSRDEGLGDSPTNPLGSGGQLGLLQSIWSDVGPSNRENESANNSVTLTALTA